MSKGKLLAAALVVVVAAKYKTLVLRGILQGIFEVRLALFRAGLWPLKTEDLFAEVDKNEPPSTELAVFCHVVKLLMKKEEWNYERAMKALKTFYELGLFWHWSGVPGHQVETVEVGPSKVACHFVSSSETQIRKDAAIVYLHGGGYISGTFQSYKPFTVRLSERCKTVVMFVDYTLVPKKKLEDVQEEIMDAYSYLITERGFDPSKVIISGDSAGGGHCLGVLQKIAQRGLPKPAGGALISPYCDLTASSKSFRENEKDIFFGDRDFLERVGEAVLKTSNLGSEPHNPDVSFGFGSFQNLAPIYVCVGQGERLYNDSTLICKRAREAGVPVEMDEQRYGVHDFPLLNFRVPEFHAGFDRLTDFIKSRI